MGRMPHDLPHIISKGKSLVICMIPMKHRVITVAPPGDGIVLVRFQEHQNQVALPFV